MLMVIKDMLKNDLHIEINNSDEIIFIGDTWHDEEAAKTLGINFLEAKEVHNLTDKLDFLSLVKSKYLENNSNGSFYN